MKKILLITIVLFTACTTPANERVIRYDSAVSDINELEKQTPYLEDYQLKVLHSMAFIADEANMDRNLAEPLFLLFTEQQITYEQLLDELELKHSFSEQFIKEHFAPLYQAIDQLCVYRQNIVNKAKQNIAVLDTLALPEYFKTFIDRSIKDSLLFYEYNTPAELYGDCPYLFEQDSLYILKSKLMVSFNQRLKQQFANSTFYSESLDSLYRVHK